MKITMPPEHAYNFPVGVAVAINMHARRIAGWRLALWHMGQLALRLTRWWRPRTVVSAVNHKTGTITLVDESWSWRRWRWERVA